MVQDLVFLFFVFMLGLVGNNHLVTLSALILATLRVSGMKMMIDSFADYGIQAGLIVLTMSVMIPFASGEAGFGHVINTVRTPCGIIAILVGVFVTYLGREGVTLLQVQPEVMVGLIVGSLIGVALFRGVPVGPLIAAGGVAVLMEILGRL